jgi:iron(III) transport system ATP-binding protein
MADAAMRAGERVTVTVRPENVALVAGDAPGSDDVIAGTVDSVVYLGNALDCAVIAGGERVRVQLHPATPIARGQSVRLRLPRQYCLAMRP